MKIFSVILITLIVSCKQSDIVESETTDFQNFNNQNSLIIKAYIRDDTDCGEWGGHLETVKIYKHSKNLVLLYRRDSSDCRIIYSKRKEKELEDLTFEYKVNLNSDLTSGINQFVAQLNSFDPSEDLSSNAPNHYTIEFKDRHITKTTQIMDWSGDWEGYKKFRKVLLNNTTTNKR